MASPLDTVVTLEDCKNAQLRPLLSRLNEEMWSKDYQIECLRETLDLMYREHAGVEYYATASANIHNNVSQCLKKEVRALLDMCDSAYVIHESTLDPYFFRAMIRHPTKGDVSLMLYLTPGYPRVNPLVQFQSGIDHPNIRAHDGAFMVCGIHSSFWQPGMELKDLMNALYHLLPSEHIETSPCMCWEYDNP